MKHCLGGVRLSKVFKNKKKDLGAVIIAIGVGVILTVIIPLWGWVIAAGGALIYCGWRIMRCN
jgi:hypothetical protein